jgi:hypothetical protein
MKWATEGTEASLSCTLSARRTCILEDKPLSKKPVFTYSAPLLKRGETRLANVDKKNGNFLKIFHKLRKFHEK